MINSRNELSNESENLLNFIQGRLNLYRGKKKIDDILASTAKDLVVLNIGNTVHNIADMHLFPKQLLGDIVLVLTQELQKEIVEKSISLEDVVQVLEELNKDFVKGLGGEYRNLQKLLEHFQVQENQSQDIYNFENFTKFINDIENSRGLRELKQIVQQYKEQPKKLEEFLQYPSVLTNKIFLLRSIASAIIHTRNEVGMETRVIISEEDYSFLQSLEDIQQDPRSLQQNREKECYEHFIQTTILLPYISRLELEAQEKYAEEYPNVDRFLKISEKINQYSNYISVAYIFSVILIFFTQTDTQLIGEYLAAQLEKKYNVTEYKDKDWSEYFYNDDVLSLHASALAIIQLFGAFPSLLFFSHHAKHVNSYIMRTEEQPKLLNVLIGVMSFRWVANLGMQFIDVTSNPLKDKIMKATVFRWIVPTAIIEESGKISSIKENLSTCELGIKNDVQRMRVGISKSATYTLAIFSLFLEYATTYGLDFFMEKDSQNNSLYNTINFWLNIGLKSWRSFALIVPAILDKKNLYDVEYRKFISNGLTRTLSSLVAIPLYENVRSVRYIGLISALDTLLTASPDRECGDAITRISHQTNVYYIREKLMELYKRASSQSTGEKSVRVGETQISGPKTSQGTQTGQIVQHQLSGSYEQDLFKCREYFECNPYSYLHLSSISQQGIELTSMKNL